MELIIIGAGPTGLACAIEAQKANLDYVILEKGLLVNSIYNFPVNMTFFSTSNLLEIGGVPFISHNDKPTRREALEYYRRLTASWDIKIHFNEKVLHENALIKNQDGEYIIHTSKNTYACRNLIICTGFYDNYNKLNVPGEELSKVRHYYDDAHHYIQQNVLVIGAANSACDVALETFQKGAHVTMVIRGSEIYEKVKYWIKPNIENRIKEGSIKAFFNSKVKSIEKEHVIIDTPEGELKIDNDYVLAMTGYQPNFTFFKRLGITLSEGDNVPIYNPENLESNLDNVYLAGVILAGGNTSKLFIENTRHHGKIIIEDIINKKQVNA